MTSPSSNRRPVFTELYPENLPIPDGDDEMRHWQEQERQFFAASDERNTILVGALLVENALDLFLAAFIPDFKSLEKAKEFTFSMKTSLARALCLCPRAVFNATDAVRNLRNQIAHHIECNTFDKIEPKYLESMRGHRKNMPSYFGGQKLDKNDEEAFRALCTDITMYYRKHADQLRLMRSFLLTAGFKEPFEHFCSLQEE